MRKRSCVAIYGDAFATRFMQDADVFERFKVIAEPARITLTLKDDCTDAQAMADLKKILEAAGQRVVAVFIPNVPDGAWVDETVKSISNGTHWGLLKDALDFYDFTTE
ncbi:MAG: hypothetical protein M0R80_07550 [Proteobacteria bacterium]|jgi:hypothetical protein|nr:hypothetical protein [Pseudomonadota bacterium]